MRLIDIVKEAEKLKGEDIHTLFLWAVDAEFTPLILETRLGRDRLIIHFKPVSYRRVVRYYIAQELANRSQIYSRLYLQIPIRDLYYDLLFDGISQVLVNDELQEKAFIRTHQRLERSVARIVAILNGIDPSIAQELQRQLKLLEDIAYAYYAEVATAPAWATPLLLSFQLFKEGGTWSKPLPVDEPYLLWQAWFAIARGERRYYDAKFSSTSSATTISGHVPTTPSAAEIDIPVQAISSLRDAIDIDGLMEVLRDLEKK